jgi:hypothetical protein
MASEYIVVTMSGNAVVVEESFTDPQAAANLLASGTGDCIMHGYNVINP